MERVCILFLLFIGYATMAHAAIPTAGYVHDFFNAQCHNQNLDIPGEQSSNLTAQKYVLGIIDSLNEAGSTYAADATSNNIVSLGYLHETVPFLADSMTCCLGGAVGGDGECRGCGTWVRQTEKLCWDAGQYRVGDACKSCPDGYMCPDGTAGKVFCGAGYWCKNNIKTECDHKRNQCPYSNHTSLPDTIACDNGFSFAYTTADKCIDAGVYRSGTNCVPCTDGWLCPAGTNGRTSCDAGFWCKDNVKTECEHGKNQCPDAYHGFQPTTIACDDGYTITATSAVELCPDGEYNKSGTCTACPDGYWCPGGTNGRVGCGIGYWCAGGIRTPCTGGATQCPGNYHSAQPDDTTTE